MNPAIIIENGKEINLTDWQEKNHLPENRVSKHLILGVDNLTCDDELILTAEIIDAFERIRAIADAPLKINSGYRTERKQAELRRLYNIKGQHIASNHSPHTLGLALDVDTKTTQESRWLMDICRQVRDDSVPYLRIGWKRYLEAGMTFIHIDVAPFYFGKDGVWKDRNHPPESWKRLNVEW